MLLGVDQNQPPEPSRMVESWGHRRGMAHTSYNHRLVLVRADVETVAKHLALHAVRWERDVLGKTVSPGIENALVFRLQDHAWTEVFGHGIEELTHFPGNSILYYVSDTCGSIGYTYSQNGEILESFFGEVGSGSRPNKTTSHFSSKLRKTTLKDIKNVWRFTEQFLQEQEAYEPGLTYEYFLQPEEIPESPRLIIPGESPRLSGPRITNNGIKCWTSDKCTCAIPILERIDFLVFRDAPFGTHV